MSATCPSCGGYLMPVGDGTNAICGAHVDGKCEQGRLFPSPGESACVTAYLRQSIEAVATYDRKKKAWFLDDGSEVKKGFLCRSHLTWNTLTVGGQPVAKFGVKQRLRTFKRVVATVAPRPIDASALAAK